jgi:predicted ribosomally synthesized peptide with nif11-like leader
MVSKHSGLPMPPSDTTIPAFIEAVQGNETLQRQLRLATTAGRISELAQEAGFALEPAQLVKHYARLLLEAEDGLAVRNFDRCGWDAGELLWLLKTWEA